MRRKRGDKETPSPAPSPSNGTVVFRAVLLLSPFLVNDFLYSASGGDQEPIRTLIDLATTAWALTLGWLTLRLGWWDRAALTSSANHPVTQIVTGLGYGAAILFGSIFVRGGIWLVGGYSGFDYPFPGAWSGFEDEPVWNVSRILLVCIAGALVEEIVFRGALLQMFRASAVTAERMVLLCALAYAAAHWSGGPLVWVTAFGFGALWTVLFKRIGYAGTAAAHALFDIVTAAGFQERIVARIFDA